MVIAEIGALSICSFVPLLGKVREGHSCPFLSDSVIEVSGVSVKLAFDARCLFMFLSVASQREQVIGSLFRGALGTTRTIAPHGNNWPSKSVWDGEVGRGE